MEIRALHGAGTCQWLDGSGYADLGEWRECSRVRSAKPCSSESYLGRLDRSVDGEGERKRVLSLVVGDSLRFMDGLSNQGWRINIGDSQRRQIMKHRSSSRITCHVTFSQVQIITATNNQDLTTFL